MSGANPCVLVVDDDPANVSLYVDVLTTEAHFDIETASDGQQALARARARAFDLIISDLTMPQLDGVSLLKEVKRLNPNVEVIIVTGAGSATTAVDAFRSQVFDYLQKPVDIDNLLTSVHRAITKSGIRSTIDRLRASLPGAAQRQGDIFLGHVCVDDQLVIVDADPHCVTGMGLGSGRLDGRRLSDLPAVHFLLEAFAGVLQGEPLPTRRTEVLGLHDDLRTMTYSIGPIVPSIRAGLMAAVILDDTHWRRSERERRARERLTAMAQMAHVVEEQVENHLGEVDRSAGTIQGLLDTLGGLRPNLTVVLERGGAHCGSVLQEIGRLRSLLGTFWEFARQYVPEVQPVALNQVVNDLLDGADFRARRGRIDVALDPGVKTVEANPREVGLIVSHLLQNALRATEQGGRVKVMTEARGPMTVLTVQDQGVGIPPENLEKVFLPFFSTWGPEKKKGLGLAVVQKIVDDHGGVVAVEAWPDVGSRFTVTLPVKQST